ncbi:YIP1 family protein [Clostridium thermarum]|uniref:YIP1 family protein n=1 Tax=Clostridium thermarum TaxID=1716543 RepID=UPI00111CFD37|nr:YIP1 family protein [Clostridium thermarum]
MIKTLVKRATKSTIAAALGILLALGFSTQSVRAENAPAYTYTISEDLKWVRTQDAYLNGEILFRDIDLKKPEDIFVKDGRIYVADTGNGRITIKDLDTDEVTFIGEDTLSSPTGVYVDEEDNIIAADYDLEQVVKFSPVGAVLKTYGRPDTPIFGKTTNFKPKKALSDKKGNIYIVSEGTYDGIIQFSKEGEFLGYFGANNTSKSLIEAIQDLVFTEAQKAKLFNRIPKSFYNLAIDKKGMTYTITQGERGHAIKKHNVSGSDILASNHVMIDEENFVDITVGTYGQIYALTETGLIYEYDSEGNLIFSFGGRAISTERNGLFTVGAGIAVDKDNYIYVLDKERNVVQVFYPTVFAEMIHEAISLFEIGKYLESKDLWQQILQLSGTSKIAYDGLGKAYFQENDYKQAAENFRLAQNREDYSESYWEIRNEWLQDNIAVMLILLVLAALISKVLKKIDSKKGIFNPIRGLKAKLKENRLVRDLLYLKRVLRHPIDCMYEIRKDRQGSTLAATIIYAGAFIIFTINYIGRSFIFNYVDARNISYFYIISISLLPVALWAGANYMVSSINDGEGRFKDVYTATAYSLAPFIILMPFVIALTYVLTLNEAFIIELASLIIWVWCGVILFLGLKEIHNYEVGEVIKSIILSLFLILVGIICFSIVYMLWDQLMEFVYSVLREVAYNARK